MDDAETYLRSLATELHRRERSALLTFRSGRVELKVGNPMIPALGVTVRCDVTDGDRWYYLWEWSEPIGPVDQGKEVADQVAGLLRVADER